MDFKLREKTIECLKQNKGVRLNAMQIAEWIYSNNTKECIEKQNSSKTNKSVVIQLRDEILRDRKPLVSKNKNIKCDKEILEDVYHFCYVDNNDLSIKDLILSFRKKWSIEKIKTMTFDEYTNLEKDCFIYDIEFGYRRIGGISGQDGASRFGIYTIDDNSKKNTETKNIEYGEKYAWRKKYGNDYVSAFKKIRNNVNKIIEYSINKEWEKIDKIDIDNKYKWKIAYIYQDIENPTITPLFTDELRKFSLIKRGYILDKTLSVSDLYIMIKEEYSISDIYKTKQVSTEVYDEWEKSKNTKIKPSKINRNNGRNGTTDKVSSTYEQPAKTITVTYEHNKLENSFMDFLKNRKINANKNEKYMDIIFSHNKNFYICELKPKFSEVRMAIGQLIHYQFFSQQKDVRKILVFKEKLNTDDIAFLNYIEKEYSFKYLYEIDFGEFKGNIEL